MDRPTPCRLLRREPVSRPQGRPQIAALPSPLQGVGLQRPTPDRKPSPRSRPDAAAMGTVRL